MIVSFEDGEVIHGERLYLLIEILEKLSFGFTVRCINVDDVAKGEQRRVVQFHVLEKKP